MAELCNVVVGINALSEQELTSSTITVESSDSTTTARETSRGICLLVARENHCNGIRRTRPDARKLHLRVDQVRK